MIGDEFKVKKVCLIGESEWRLPVNEKKGEGYFDYHYVAIDGEYTKNDNETYVYDCCLKYYGNKSGEEKLAIREPLSLEDSNKDSYKQSILYDSERNSCKVNEAGKLYFGD